MSLYLIGAIEEKSCDCEGCPTCEYQIIETKDVCACLLSDVRVGSVIGALIDVASALGRDSSIYERLWNGLGDVSHSEDKLLPTTWIDTYVSETEPLETLVFEKYGPLLHCDKDLAERVHDKNDGRLLIRELPPPGEPYTDENSAYTLVFFWDSVTKLTSYLKRARKLGRVYYD
jgi:hypothetical protein